MPIGSKRTGCGRQAALWVLAGVAVFALSTPLAVSHIAFCSPDEALRSALLAVQYGIAQVFNPSAIPGLQESISQIPAYYEVRTRLLVSLLTAACGALLAVSGSVYQLVFRNPLAAPTMLGVSNGVSCGVLLLVLQCGAAAAFMTAERYLYCFAGAVIVLAAVIGITAAASGLRNFSVITMLLVASIISQILGAVTSYVTSMLFDDATLVVYQEVLQVLDVTVDPLAFGVLGLTILIAVVPVCFLRFSLNSLSFSDEESAAMGVSRKALQMVALAFATVMIVSAEVLVGTVSMVSLVVPFISRALFGAEFRRQLVGNLVIGPVLLLACRTIADCIPFVGEGFPIGVVASFIMLPFFVAIVVKGQRTWE